MTTAAERRRNRAERNRIARTTQPIEPSAIATLDALMAGLPNVYRMSPPRRLEQLATDGLITREQLRAGQWYRDLFERYATHYPRVTASYNPNGYGHDDDDTDELTPANKAIGVGCWLLVGLCVFDEDRARIEMVRACLDQAAAAMRSA